MVACTLDIIKKSLGGKPINHGPFSAKKMGRLHLRYNKEIFRKKTPTTMAHFWHIVEQIRI
jgi:hypothetical protein